MRDLVLRVTVNNVVTDLDIDSNIPLRLDISTFDNSRVGVLFGVGSQTFGMIVSAKEDKLIQIKRNRLLVELGGVLDGLGAILQRTS